MNKEYIEKEYDQIVREWKCAASEEERWLLRERMAKFEHTAGSLFGTDYMDQIHSKYVGMIK